MANGVRLGMNRNILEYFPYKTIRPVQQEVLEAIERHYHEYEVFVIVAPTAFGKTAVARTIQEWTGSASVITPSNMLVNQFLGEFPETPRLHRLDSYWCEEWKQPCSATRARRMGFCKKQRDPDGTVVSQCYCSSDLAQAKYGRGSGIYNYHTYMAHRIYRPVLVVDEAHNIISTIQDRMSDLIWQHDYRYPHSMYTVGHIRAWLESLPDRLRKHKRIRFLDDAVNSPAPKYVIQRTLEWFNGKGTRRGEPEERDCIKLYPIDISDAPPVFWPAEVEKIILMSATIGATDIRTLGLDSRRVLYLQASSPIPVERRPVVLRPVVSISRGNMATALPLVASEIERIAGEHSGEKGVIHATYQMAEMLREHLSGPRYMFHTRESKREVYEQFRESPASSGAVLVACGMYEGIDLPDELGRWQVVSKVPWKSLGDPAIKWKSEEDPDWYRWNTLRDLIQACGRISRTPEDFGVTYILDGSAIRLLREGDHLVPDWFRSALIAE